MTVAELREVTKRFGSTAALDRVSIAVEPGEVVALLGPNGAGKTTALAVLLGLRSADTGVARLFGCDPRRADARVRVGVTPQETAFPPTLRVSELIELVRRHYPRPARVAELCARFRLAPQLGRQAGGLSVGERRQVAVALAFVGGGELVVLDEPGTGLDTDARSAVWDAVRRHADRGGSVLFTTHHLDEAEALARRVVLLDSGAVVADGTVADLKAGGLTRVSFRAAAGDLVRADVVHAGSYVAQLVRRGVALDDLEVRPLTLEEALLARGTRR